MNELTPHNPPSFNTDETGEGAGKINLIALSRDELPAVLAGIGVPANQIRMRISQLWNWIYARGATDFDAMLNISKDLRQRLTEHCTLARPHIVTEQLSVDGTRKWLLRLAPSVPGKPGDEVEMVYIPEEDRGTLCISSQVGCTLTCKFCHTGTMPLVRNLSAQEIVGQVMLARDRTGDWPAKEADDKRGLPESERMITRLVFMGMGEPLYNFEAVKKAIANIADDAGISMSRRRITVSTSGVEPMIHRLGAEVDCMLAVSLHAVNDELRDKIMPINRKYPLEALLDACRNYPGLSNAKRITFEYVMLKDLNDSIADARELVRLLKGIPAKINLIPFNPWPGVEYECSSWTQIEKFADVVNNAGYASPIRRPRGQDIMAACGQLKSASERVPLWKRREMAGIRDDDH